MELREYIEIYSFFVKGLFFSFPIFFVGVITIRILVKNPVKKMLYLLLPMAVLWLTFFIYATFVLFKGESHIKDFVSHPNSEYSITVNGVSKESVELINSLRKMSTNLTNKTFSSRKNERVIIITKGNEMLALRVFDSSDRETFYWVVYRFPNTTYEYLGRIRNYEIH